MQSIANHLIRRTANQNNLIKSLFFKRTFFFRSNDPFTDAFHQLERTARELDRQMDRFVSSTFPVGQVWSNRFPWPFESTMIRQLPIELAADGTRLYSLRLHLPGFQANDIQVTLRDNTLSVRARYSSESNRSNSTTTTTTTSQRPDSNDAAQAKQSAETNNSKSVQNQSQASSVNCEANGDSQVGGTSRLIREYTYEHVLPNEVDVQRVSCKLQPDGILLIQAPLHDSKQNESSLDKEIPIKRDN